VFITFPLLTVGIVQSAEVLTNGSHINFVMNMELEKPSEFITK